MYLKELSDKIWTTKNARFLAAKRMRRRHVSSTVSMALLSASIIAVNLFAFLSIDEVQKTMIAIVTVILSVFALVMSLIITFLRYESHENNYHQCGIELDQLNQRLKIRIEELTKGQQKVDEIQTPTEDNTKYLTEYSDILKKYNLNHSELDYRYSGMLSSDRKNISVLQRVWCWFRWNVWDVNILYWLIAIIPVAIVVLVFVKEYHLA